MTRRINFGSARVMTSNLVPDSEHSGIIGLLPVKLRALALLARLDRPIGWWLLVLALYIRAGAIGWAYPALGPCFVDAAGRDRDARGGVRV